MAWFIFDEFNVVASLSTIHNILQQAKWSQKASRKHTLEHSELLRALWKGRQPLWDASQLVFVDESASNERTGYRKYGWSPRGVPAIDYQPLTRSEQWSILPAYTISGYLDGTIIMQGSITTEIFNEWIETVVLPHCLPWPGPRSVIIMDNVSIHKNEQLLEVCDAAGVHVEFLPPYSPDFNPIEESFGVLKSWIKRNTILITDFEDFGNFLAFAVHQAGGKHARQHFKDCGYAI